MKQQTTDQQKSSIVSETYLSATDRMPLPPPAVQPAFVRMAKWIAEKANRLWQADIKFKRNGKQAIALYTISAVCIVWWLYGWITHIPGIFTAGKQRIFYGVEEMPLSGLATPVAHMIVLACVFRIVFGLIMGLLDMAFYKRITGRPFDWESMINVSVVNTIFIFTILFSFMNPLFEWPLRYYELMIQQVPTIAHFSGPVALLLICLIGDFCFYWSHRWCHNIRLFWNLGHVNHHRNRNLTQLTCSVDPSTLILNASGGKSFILLLLPIFMKLFTFNITDAGWLLLAAIAFDTLTDPSHSPTLYFLEMKFKPLRWLRYVFVTTGVHFVHHSREHRHDIKGGCNFGARFTLWDRIFGTYAEPPNYIPESGLFSEQTDYCINPVRYLFHPGVRLFRELKQNKLKHWPRILFGSTAYEPPVPVNTKH